MRHEDYMRRALTLALRGTGQVSPNPLVGAVIVKNGRVIGKGWHRRYGGLHAEREALRDCLERGEDPKGAEIYVTLEPCCHQGKQPPCTEALMEAGISHVYVGSGDPNPKVCGKGLQILKDHGIGVTEHILERECLTLNEIFFHYITTGLPLVYLKYAMTLDGKIACYTGASRWITGEAARHHVHEERNRISAVMTGVGTILADDPLLTCRLKEPGQPELEAAEAGASAESAAETGAGRNPIRVVCDSRLRTPLESNIIKTAGEVPTILATCCPDPEQHRPYLAAGCEVCVCATHSQSPHVSLPDLMRKLGTRGIDSVLIEGGAELAWSALESGIVNKIQAYVAPKLFGGSAAKTPVGGQGFPDPSEAVVLRNRKITAFGDDLLIEGDVPASGVH